ncbi:DNA topoisomerase [Aster yellows witches'-broom phytoplasma AYWB]|uniref:DNA topoisomerase 1 n=2 Tax=16SrI (Aster yellows group) TaxID=3042590 RepID=Q2NJ34_AYWBP|nr:MULTISPECIES: type I DNA topoisomerase [16SrI (Aster yellows group)]ABC65559.1 DNA topoisomerase [Aster yellows witches'-broom phytoplasma AYWB]PEH36241.1 DNA topoisomerase I [New Jersey aster yellows phytoplasma]
MKSKVIIVESPTKTKTLSRFLNDDFLILSSKGHIRDLSLKGKDRMGIDIEKGFIPKYSIIKEKDNIVETLIQKTKGKEVLLATDPDREGEAIAWHLSQILNLDSQKTNRIVFREITKEAVLKALQQPRKINELLVFSQETRRMLDRIIGFKLSRLVRRLKSQSAGRVQSVALKLIVDLEEKIKAFVPEEYYIITAFFKDFQAEYQNPYKGKIKAQEAFTIVQQIKDKSFLVKELKQQETKKFPKPPFITSTLQQEAIKSLNMTSNQVMRVAQKLYEGVDILGESKGLITYMRTDSQRLADIFVKDAQKLIKKQYGEEYLGTYKNSKTPQSQDAHEAIRPTDLSKTPESLAPHLDKYENKLYKLIYQRTLASLMTPAIFQKTQVFFEVANHLFLTESLIKTFDGYQKLLQDGDKDKIIPSFKSNETYLPQEIQNLQKFTNPPSRFSEATLIKTLEKLNIGRPSTYSQIIFTLKKRIYVDLVEKRFVPTEQGILTTKNLELFFKQIIDVKYTAKMEENLDKISSGLVNKKELLQEFYDAFKQLYQIADQKLEKTKDIETDQKCNLCNAPLLIKKGRYGNFLGCSRFPECKNIVSLKEKTSSLETNPDMKTDQKCNLCNAPLLIKKGRYGNFLGCSRFPECKNIVKIQKN